MTNGDRENRDELPGDGDPIDACDFLMRTYRRKADRNRNLSLATTVVTVFASAMVPVCIVISTETGEFLFGRLLPSLLAAGAALAAGIAGVVRPYERWRTFRKWREVLAEERLSYRHGLGEYAGDDADRVLIERVIAVRRGFSDEWQTLIPAETKQAISAAQERPSASQVR